MRVFDRPELPMVNVCDSPNSTHQLADPVQPIWTHRDPTQYNEADSLVMMSSHQPPTSIDVVILTRKSNVHN